jgi:RsiW-degrading membrane proteinase PrsW (M82 family)
MYGLALIFGFLAASAALLFQVLVSIFISTPLIGAPSLPLLLGAAAIEEGAKLLFLVQLGRRSPETISLLHALVFGIGFVAAEIALLALSAKDLPELATLGSIAGVQIIGTLAIYGGLRLKENLPQSWLFGLLAAILLHTLYNSSL